MSIVNVGTLKCEHYDTPEKMPQKTAASFSTFFLSRWLGLGVGDMDAARFRTMRLRFHTVVHG